MVPTRNSWAHGIMGVVQLGLLLAIAAPFVVAIWVAARRTPPVAAGRDAFLDRPDEFPPARVSFAAETLKVEPAVRAVADTLHAAARLHSVQIELAITPKLDVRVDPEALRYALRAMLQSAIRATNGGQVLVTALIVGSQTHIRVVDDGPETDQRARESLLREASDLIALQGGSIVVEARPGRGTVVTIRLPLPGEAAATADAADFVPALAKQAA
jgi:signal transduction histidine kinase